MKTETRLMTEASLAKLVTALRTEGKRVLAPVRKEKRTDFAEINDLSEMAAYYIVTEQSAKAALLPRTETLFEMKVARDNVTLIDRDPSALPEIVLLGTRPCDAAGLASLAAIFGGDTPDSVFMDRRNRTLLISISCAKCDSRCFCTSVNLGPGATEGSDLLLTRIENNSFLVEILTEQGQALVARHAALFEAAPEVDKQRFLAEVPVAFELDPILKAMPESFNSPEWLTQSLRCIGCGACAYVCPTCACFDVQDSQKGASGVRKRSWDSCGFSLFTLHASGHNPRDTQVSRWRQRLMHKFVYMPGREKVLGCVGCGRCGRSCSVDMNLKEHLARWARAVKS